MKISMRILMNAALLLCVISLSAGAQWLNYPTAGIPRTPDGKPDLSAPAPRTADGKPDFSGVWQADSQAYFGNLAAGLKPEDVPMQPWARTLQQQRENNSHADDPLARCLPHGVPRVNTNGLFPFKIIQTPGLVVLLYEQLYLFRQVFMDGRKVASDLCSPWHAGPSANPAAPSTSRYLYIYRYSSSPACHAIPHMPVTSSMAGLPRRGFKPVRLRPNAGRTKVQ